MGVKYDSYAPTSLGQAWFAVPDVGWGNAKKYVSRKGAKIA